MRQQKEIKQLRGDVAKEVGQVRGESKTVELSQHKKIEQVRVEIVRTKNDLLERLVPLVFGQLFAIAPPVKVISGRLPADGIG